MDETCMWIGEFRVREDDIVSWGGVEQLGARPGAECSPVGRRPIRGIEVLWLVCVARGGGRLTQEKTACGSVGVQLAAILRAHLGAISVAYGR